MKTINKIINGNPDLQRLLDQHLVWKTGLDFRVEQTHAALSQVVKFGVSDIDSKLPGGGLKFGEVHEWSFKDNSLIPKIYPKDKTTPLMLPLTVLANYFALNDRRNNRERVFWIGSWPNPEFLLRTHLSKAQSFFVDVKSVEERLWSAIQVLKSSLATAIVCNAIRFKYRDLRQLEYATRRTVTQSVYPSVYQSVYPTGHPPGHQAQHNSQTGTICFILRTAEEIKEGSVCETSWQIAPAIDTASNFSIPEHNTSFFPLWSIELVHARGVITPRAWTISSAGVLSTETVDEVSRLAIGRV